MILPYLQIAISEGIPDFQTSGVWGSQFFFSMTKRGVIPVQPVRYGQRWRLKMALDHQSASPLSEAHHGANIGILTLMAWGNFRTPTSSTDCWFGSQSPMNMGVLIKHETKPVIHLDFTNKTGDGIFRDVQWWNPFFPEKFSTSPRSDLEDHVTLNWLTLHGLYMIFVIYRRTTYIYIYTIYIYLHIYIYNYIYTCVYMVPCPVFPPPSPLWFILFYVSWQCIHACWHVLLIHIFHAHSAWLKTSSNSACTKRV